MKKLFAEFFGTFWLVFGGCGSALFAADYVTPSGVHLGIGLLGVSLAFGLTVLTMAYALGPISGGHFNPAVSIGLWASGKFPSQHLARYIFAQCIGAIAAAGILYMVWTGKDGNVINSQAAGVFASNGYGSFSPSGYSMISCFIIEFVLTLFFLLVIIGATDALSHGKFAGIAIGLALTLIHLISIPITNTSVNPARSLSQAIFVGGEPLQQLWLFWVAPILGGATGGFIYKFLLQNKAIEE